MHPIRSWNFLSHVLSDGSPHIAHIRREETRVLAAECSGNDTRRVVTFEADARGLCMRLGSTATIAVPVRVLCFLSVCLELLPGLGFPPRAAAAGPVPPELKRRCAKAFKPLPIPPPARLEKEATPELPKGIVIEAAPFRALTDRLGAPSERRLALRREVLRALKTNPGDRAARLIRSGLQALDKEDAGLVKRIAGVEKSYSEVYNRGYMESSAGARRTRKLAAVLIPLYRGLALENEKLTTPAAAALSAMSEEQALALLGDKSPRVRIAALAAVGPNERARLGTSDKHPLVRAAALGALMAYPPDEVKETVFRALRDKAWNVRALAVEICVRAELLEAVGPLIAALEHETGRLRKDIDDALHALTKAQFFGDVALWKNWWKQNKARVLAEAAKRPHKEPLGLPSAWKRRGSKAGSDDSKRKGFTSAFYGIPTVSKRVLFLIDISRSMTDPSQARPATTTTKRKKTRYPAPKGSAKIDIAKWQLHRAVEALPKDALFNILVYSESYKVWESAPVPAKNSNKSKAHKFIESIHANGVTNICDSIDKGFELAGTALYAYDPKNAEPPADTLYLLSDGDPNRGRITDLDRLLEDIRRRNPPGALVIHAVGIGEAAGSSFLRALAEENGGRYVGYK